MGGVELNPRLPAWITRRVGGIPSTAASSPLCRAKLHGVWSGASTIGAFVPFAAFSLYSRSGPSRVQESGGDGMAVVFGVEYEVHRPIDAVMESYFAFHSEPADGSIRSTIIGDQYVQELMDNGTKVKTVATFEAIGKRATKIRSTVSMEFGPGVSPGYEQFAQQAMNSVPAGEQRASMEAVARKFEAFIDQRTVAPRSGGPELS